MVTFHEPLEISYWFVQVFSGSMTIFAFVGLLAITWACAMFKMPPTAFVIMLVLFSAILFTAGFTYLWILFVIIFALLLFWVIRRLVD